LWKKSLTFIPENIVISRSATILFAKVYFSMNDIQERIAISFKSQRLMTTLGAQLVSVADGEVQIVLPFSEHLSQQHGYVHAGAITSIVDSACGYAALTKAPPECEVVTAEFKINFLRPAIGERFLAIGKVQSSGKFLTICTGEVRAFVGADFKVVGLMQATIVNVRS
jgi:uncharacterized protein (TIGR00369 family)